MRLSAIKLAGFKSFVEPTTLALNGNLTAVVGPNGCGKSNVIDAVRWVTGESSAKQLRGEALEDVIFNGAGTRNPVGRAAVELRFDNSDAAAGGPYARFADIAIRRELTRDGDSRYFINGARVRRRDVVDLFLGTGLGGRSNYAVIEQGAVNRLVEAKPDDMRQVLEEAAGISRYKERRRETENRIRHTRDNLERLQDRIGEISERLAVLKRQARNAEKYKQLKQDERRWRAELLALRWRAFDRDVQAAQGTLNTHEQTLADAVSTQRQAHNAGDAAAQARDAAADACQQHQAALYTAQGEATRIAQALEHARHVHTMRQRERDQLVSQRDELEARVAEDQDALTQVEQTLATARTQLRAQQQTRDTARQQVEAVDTAVAQAERQRDAYDGQDTPVARLQAERTQRRYLLQRIEHTQASRAQRHSEAEALTAADDADALPALAAQIDTLSAQVEAGDAQLREVAQALTTVRDDKADLTQRLDAARTRLAQLQARLASEKTMQQGVLREDDDSVRTWLAQQGYTEASSVARQVDTVPAWQTAAEAALADWLSGFTVERLTSAATWPDGRMTLVESRPPCAAQTVDELAGLPSLASGLQAPAAVMAVAARIFVAADVATALAVRAHLQPGQMIVCVDGVCVGPASLRAPPADTATRGVLERERNIKSLTAAAEAATTHVDSLQAQLHELTQQQQAQQQQHDQTQRTRDQANRDLSGCRAQYQGMSERREHRRRRAQELAQEQAQLAQQLEQDNAELQALDARITTLCEQAEAYARERDAARAALIEARDKRSTARQRLDDAEACLRRSEQDQAAARSRHDSLATRLAQAHTARTQALERLTAFDAEAAQGRGEQAPTTAEHDAAQARRQAADSALRDARGALETAQQQGEQATRAAMRADDAVAQARDAVQQARIDVETAVARREGLNEQLQEQGADVASLLQQLDDNASVAAWQAEIETAQRRIARLGAINLAAIEEYDEELQREQYLNAQHQDLSAALATLDQAIARIDRETRNRFKTTFAQVNERFGRMFPTLFGGGKASLELTEQDVLSTGVRVMARPPGKRNASIQMLSGGEKALTALALLFALFELNPAPFCMLDEIDAPLDDSNVSRFCDLLRQMSDNIQFIVITHNKLTMELATQLHGVTMAEPGVSRLVSVNIDQALDMAG